MAVGQFDRDSIVVLLDAGDLVPPADPTGARIVAGDCRSQTVAAVDLGGPSIR